MPQRLTRPVENLTRGNIVCAWINMACANDDGIMIVCGHQVECTGTLIYRALDIRLIMPVLHVSFGKNLPAERSAIAKSVLQK